MTYKNKRVGSLNAGTLLIDPKSGQVCKITSMKKGKVSKHGSAKAQIVTIGVFDHQKRRLTLPVDKNVKVPIVDRRVAQIISIDSDSYYLMDMEAYSNFEIEPPKDQEMKQIIEKAFNEGKIVYLDYRTIMNRFKIDTVRESEP